MPTKIPGKERDGLNSTLLFHSKNFSRWRSIFFREMVCWPILAYTIWPKGSSESRSQPKMSPSSSLDFSRGNTRKKWRITFGRADELKMRESFYFVSPLWEKKERENGGGASFRSQQRQRIDSENSGTHCHPNRPQCGPTKKEKRFFWVCGVGGKVLRKKYYKE